MCASLFCILSVLSPSLNSSHNKEISEARQSFDQLSFSRVLATSTSTLSSCLYTHTNPHIHTLYIHPTDRHALDAPPLTERSLFLLAEGLAIYCPLQESYHHHHTCSKKAKDSTDTYPPPQHHFIITTSRPHT